MSTAEVIAPPSASPAQPLELRIGGHSLIYTATNALQKGTLFLLLPVYTRYLSPADYGVVAVVTASVSFLVVLFTLSLHGAMTRFYFEYRDHPEQLKEFWGTQLTAVLLVSAVGTGLLFLFGEQLAGRLLGGIPFWPYLGIGLLTALFQPVFTIFLALLQIREQALRYSIFSFAQFAATLMLVLSLVVGLKWGATGALAGTMAASGLFWVIALFALRGDVRFGLRMNHLRTGFGYSLPLLPHSLASQISVITDRMLLNSLMSTAAAGIYNVGYVLGSALSFVADGVNRAYVPASMDILKTGQESQLERLRSVVLLIITGYVALATLVSFFGFELIRVFATPEFLASHIVIPYIAFAFALTGLYSVLVNILFFVCHATRLVAVATICAGLVNVGLNLLLIPRFGIRGAAISALGSQLLAALLTGAIGAKYEMVRWPYLRLAALFAAGLGASVIVVESALHSQSLIKLGLFPVLAALLSTIAWGDPVYILRRHRLRYVLRAISPGTPR